MLRKIAVLILALAACEKGNLEPAGNREVKVLDLTAAGAAVSGLSIGLRIGQTLQLYVSPKDALGNPVPDAVVTWAASPPSVATVSATWLVTAVSPGTAVISVTSGTISASLTFSVLNTPVISVTVTPAIASLTVGQAIQLSAMTRDS